VEAIGRGWGKLLLFGEHAAVYGYPALGMALPSYVEVALERSGDRWVLPELTTRYAGLARQLLDRLEHRIGERLGTEVAEWLRGTLHVRSTVPTSLGYGSSGAVCTALARAVAFALSEARDEPPADEFAIWELANDLERVFHGTPSGIDTGLATFGDLRYFSFDGPGLPRVASRAPLRGYILTAAVPRSGDTKSLVGEIRRRWDAEDGVTRRRIRELGEIAAEAAALLESSNEPDPENAEGDTAATVWRLGTLAARAQEALAALELSSPHLGALLDVAGRRGSLGGKLSGAGGGGAFYALFDDETKAMSAVEAVTGYLQDHGLQDMPVQLLDSGPGGVHELSEERLA
jgi:mevalonate kinase